ncbi:hypothetical protein OIU76_002987 [Salix suchowensis]|nr:hypothetical protein OIU78_019214 [Salix suchowensis]KAJ6354067.1 hypothetical protein OIU76_002987 [Salix suchowensis]
MSLTHVLNNNRSNREIYTNKENAVDSSCMVYSITFSSSATISANSSSVASCPASSPQDLVPLKSCLFN